MDIFNDDQIRQIVKILNKFYLPILNFPDLITNASLAVTFDSAVCAVVAALAFELI